MSDAQPPRPRLELGILRERREPDGRRWFSLQFGLLRLVAFEIEPFVADPNKPTLIGEFSCFLEQNVLIAQQAVKRRERRRQQRIASTPIRPPAPHKQERRNFSRPAPPDAAPPPTDNPEASRYPAPTSPPEPPPPPESNDRDEAKPPGRFEPRRPAVPVKAPPPMTPRSTKRLSAKGRQAAAAREVLERLGTADAELNDTLDDVGRS